jgi:hypothetical protein
MDHFQKPPLGGRPNTKHQDTMTLRTLTTVDLFYFIMHKDPHEQKPTEMTFGRGPSHIWLHTTLKGPWPHYTMLEVCCRALHRVPIPMPMTMPMGFGWAWVGMGAILLFMGGHGWASVLCILASGSKSKSNFSDAGNTLTKKRPGLKPTTMNNLLFVRSNQDLV